MPSKVATRIPAFISRSNCTSLGGVVSPTKPVVSTGIAVAEWLAAMRLNAVSWSVAVSKTRKLLDAEDPRFRLGLIA